MGSASSACFVGVASLICGDDCSHTLRESMEDFTQSAEWSDNANHPLHGFRMLAVFDGQGHYEVAKWLSENVKAFVGNDAKSVHVDDTADDTQRSGAKGGQSQLTPQTFESSLRLAFLAMDKTLRQVSEERQWTLQVADAVGDSRALLWARRAQTRVTKAFEESITNPDPEHFQAKTVEILYTHLAGMSRKEARELKGKHCTKATQNIDRTYVGNLEQSQQFATGVKETLGIETGDDKAGNAGSQTFSYGKQSGVEQACVVSSSTSASSGSGRTSRMASAKKSSYIWADIEDGEWGKEEFVCSWEKKEDGWQADEGRYPYPQVLDAAQAEPHLNSNCVGKADGDRYRLVQTCTINYNDEFRKVFEESTTNPDQERCYPEAVENFHTALVGMFGKEDRGMTVKYCIKVTKNIDRTYAGHFEQFQKLFNLPGVKESLSVESVTDDEIKVRTLDKKGNAGSQTLPYGKQKGANQAYRHNATSRSEIGNSEMSSRSPKYPKWRSMTPLARVLSNVAWGVGVHA